MDYIRENENKFKHRAAAVINLEHLANNIRNIKSTVPKSAKLMAIVKADAYGHGVLPIAKTAIKNGVDWFGVAIIEEALELRNGGIKEPILVLGHTQYFNMDICIKNDITLTIFDFESARMLSDACQILKKPVDVHIKIDTGMGRIGFLTTKENANIIEKINKLPYINITGIYTHLAQSDTVDKSYAHKQFKDFLSYVDYLKRIGIDIKIKHISNSGAVADLRTYDLDLVRTGILIYGLEPSDSVDAAQFNLNPVLELKSYVSYVKELGADNSIGYGRTYLTNKNTIVATVPFGYADGYSRGLSNLAKVIINGEYARVIGNICMDQFMVDATNIKNIKQGDEVTLIGNDSGKSITASDLAKLENTINYEILCNISKRVKRIYI